MSVHSIKSIITPNNYIQYDKFAGFKVLKANDNVVSNVDNSQQIQINDYGRTLNAINYSAIKYLTEKYEFIRTTFIDFRGNWATQLTDDLPVYSITFGNGGYRLNNYYDWTCDPMPFVNAVNTFFNSLCNPEFLKGNEIILDSFTINFKVHVIAGKTYYYIDNLFMTDNNAKYHHNNVERPAIHVQSNDKDALSNYRDKMYDNVYTILLLIPGVLEKNNSVNKKLIERTLYMNKRLEHYIIDANKATGYKLI